MIKYVIKRDGRKKIFESARIHNAIEKAFIEVFGEHGYYEPEIDKIEDSIKYQINKIQGEEIFIESVQDIVINEIAKVNKIVAKSYKDYRDKRTDVREKERSLDPKLSEIINIEGDYIKANANKDAKVFATQRDLIAGIVARDYALRKLIPSNVAEYHKNGYIYWHDFDYSPFFPMINCMLIDFKGMLQNGFVMGNAEIESPKSIETATALVAQIVANTSSNIYGGTSFNRADEVLDPYAEKTYEKHLIVAKEFMNDAIKQEEYAKKMTIKSIYNAMQSLEYELNTLYNSNGQTPFFTIGFGLGTSWICREIQKAILQVRIDGLGKDHKTAVFPKLIYVQKKGLNLESNDVNYDIRDIALDCSIRRMYPDIVNYDKIVELTGNFKFPMSCRSFLSKWEDENGNEVNDGRNNMGVVTINPVRIAIESKGDKPYFWNKLDEVLKISKEALMYRISTLDRAKAKNAPILWQYGANGVRLDADDNVSDIFKNGRASVSLGYTGLYEVGALFYGEEWEKNSEAKQFTLDIVKRLYDATVEWKNETGYGFSVYCTPCESLTHTFCTKDKEDYGDIPNVTSKGYYTNSFHYDVRKTITPFEKIDFEKDYVPYCSGGFIHYCEFPSLIHNKKALDSVWKYTYDKIGYFGTNTPIDKCYKCGYEGEFLATDEGFKCPQCSNQDPQTTSCCRRQCGYLGNPLQRPSITGRLKEQQARKKHM